MNGGLKTKLFFLKVKIGSGLGSTSSLKNIIQLQRISSSIFRKLVLEENTLMSSIHYICRLTNRAKHRFSVAKSYRGKYISWKKPNGALIKKRTKF